jgi:hypothetical protein
MKTSFRCLIRLAGTASVAIALAGVSAAGHGAISSAPVGPTAPLARPLAFEANRGQVDAQVQFVARGAAYTAFLTRGRSGAR